MPPYQLDNTMGRGPACCAARARMHRIEVGLARLGLRLGLDSVSFSFLLCFLFLFKFQFDLHIKLDPSLLGKMPQGSEEYLGLRKFTFQPKIN